MNWHIRCLPIWSVMKWCLCVCVCFLRLPLLLPGSLTSTRCEEKIWIYAFKLFVVKEKAIQLSSAALLQVCSLCCPEFLCFWVPQRNRPKLLSTILTGFMCVCSAQRWWGMCSASGTLHENATVSWEPAVPRTDVGFFYRYVSFGKTAKLGRFKSSFLFLISFLGISGLVCNMRCDHLSFSLFPRLLRDDFSRSSRDPLPPLQECSSYSFTEDVKTGCQLQVNLMEKIQMLFNGTKNKKLFRNTFEMFPLDDFTGKLTDQC